MDEQEIMRQMDALLSEAAQLGGAAYVVGLPRDDNPFLGSDSYEPLADEWDYNWREAENADTKDD